MITIALGIVLGFILICLLPAILELLFWFVIFGLAVGIIGLVGAFLLKYPAMLILITATILWNVFLKWKGKK